jgi:hypothetical protein
VDDILLANNDVNLMLEKKKFCPQVSIRMITVKRHLFQELELIETKEKWVLELSQVYT